MAGEAGGGAAAAVFLLPSATGTALGFRPLFRALPPPHGTAVYAVRDPSLVGRAEARSLPFVEWAALLADAVQATVAHGPYVLVAHGGGGAPGCWGCAEALLARGETVARLVLLDGRRPAWRAGADADAFDQAVRHARRFPASLSLAGGGGGAPSSPLAWVSSQLEQLPTMLQRLGLAPPSPSSPLPSSPSRLSRSLSDVSSPLQRRQSLASVFAHFCGRLDAVWDLNVVLGLERGVAGVAERAEVEAHEGAEDALDCVARAVAQQDDEAPDVAHVRAVARCASDALARPLPFVPSRLSATALVLVTAGSGGDEADEWPSLAGGTYADLAASVSERVVPLRASEGSEAARRAASLSAVDGHASPLTPTLRCMHDADFLAAAHAAIFATTSDV